MNNHFEIADWLCSGMEPGKWYDCPPEKFERIKEAHKLLNNIELLYKNGKIKKTEWKDGKPR